MDHNLAEMSPTVNISERLSRVVKRKLLVHDGPDLAVLIRPQHLLEPIPRPVEHALERDVPPQREHVGVELRLGPGRVELARQVPDARDEAAKRHTVERLEQRARAAALEDDVCARAARYGQDLVVPGGRAAVVYGVVGAEGAGAREFLVRRGRDDCCEEEGKKKKDVSYPGYGETGTKVDTYEGRETQGRSLLVRPSALAICSPDVETPPVP